MKKEALESLAHSANKFRKNFKGKRLIYGIGIRNKALAALRAGASADEVARTLDVTVVTINSWRRNTAHPDAGDLVPVSIKPDNPPTASGSSQSPLISDETESKAIPLRIFCVEMTVPAGNLGAAIAQVASAIGGGR